MGGAVGEVRRVPPQRHLDDGEHEDEAGQGAAAASSFASAGGADLVGAPLVERGAATARAVVTVEVPRLLPGFPSTVARTSVAPVERFVPEEER